MAFKFHCPMCGKKLQADETEIGTESPCPFCHVPITVPSGPTPPPRAAGGVVLLWHIVAALLLLGSVLIVLSALKGVQFTQARIDGIWNNFKNIVGMGAGISILVFLSSRRWFTFPAFAICLFVTSAILFLPWLSPRVREATLQRYDHPNSEFELKLHPIVIPPDLGDPLKGQTPPPLPPSPTPAR